MMHKQPFATFALRYGAARVYFAEGSRGRVGTLDRAAQFESREAAWCRATELGMSFPWVTVPVVDAPTVDPMQTLLAVRRAIPERGPLKENVLRSLRPELDRIAAELRRARRRRYVADLKEAA